jgi:hypothetical protein
MIKVPLTGLACALLVLSTFACAESAVPDRLIGTWYTDVESHADRRFRVTHDSLFLETAPGVMQAYRITAVRHYGGTGERAIRIDYERQGLDNTLRLQLDADSALVRLASRPSMVWRLTGEDGP